jgi:hypothetical protein
VNKINTESSQIVRFRLKSAQRHPITLHIEPWGEEITMAPDRLYEIAIKGPSDDIDDIMEVATEGNDLFIYGWTGSTATVHHDLTLLCDCHIPVPPTPLRIK